MGNMSLDTPDPPLHPDTPDPPLQPVSQLNPLVPAVSLEHLNMCNMKLKMIEKKNFYIMILFTSFSR